MELSDNLVSQPMASLVNAQSVTFTARVWFARYGFDGEPGAGLVPGQAFAVKALRPGCLRIEEVRTDPVIKEAIARAGCFSGTPFGFFVSDGTRQYELSVTSQVYNESAAAPVLAAITSRWKLPAVLEANLLFADDPLAYFSEVGEDEIEGARAIVFVRTESDNDERIQHRLSIDTESGLPVRLSRFSGRGADEWLGVGRIDFVDWQLDLPLPDSTFDTMPPPEAKPEPPPKPWFDPQWKAGMEPAPLDAVDLEGNPVSLAAYRGKVLLLDYWATWCQPCLTEMWPLKELYEKVHSDGLEVIGISLDREGQQDGVRECLKRMAIPWRQVCDMQGFDSPLAKAYQVGAIPFNVLIGRDGRIAAVNLHDEELEEAIERELDLTRGVTS